MTSWTLTPLSRRSVFFLAFLIFGVASRCQAQQSRCSVENFNSGLVDRVEWLRKCNGTKPATGFGIAKYWREDSVLMTIDGYFKDGRFIAGRKEPSSGKPVYCGDGGRCVTDFGNNIYRIAFTGATSDAEGLAAYKEIMVELEEKVRNNCFGKVDCSTSVIAKQFVHAINEDLAKRRAEEERRAREIAEENARKRA